MKNYYPNTYRNLACVNIVLIKIMGIVTWMNFNKYTSKIAVGHWSR